MSESNEKIETSPSLTSTTTTTEVTTTSTTTTTTTTVTPPVAVPPPVVQSIVVAETGRDLRVRQPISYKEPDNRRTLGPTSGTSKRMTVPLWLDPSKL